MNLTHQWNYFGADGALLGYVTRFDGVDGKVIRPHFVPDGSGGFNMGAPPAPRPLYGLVDALQAANKPLFIVEGEKCADAILGLGFVAVTSLGGSNAPHLSDWGVAAKHSGPLYLLPDNDAPGEKYAQEVARLVNNPNLRIVRLSGLPAGGDVVDWLQSLRPAWNGYQPLKDVLGLDELETTRTLLLDECAKGLPPTPPPAINGDSAIEIPQPLLPAMREGQPYPAEALGPYLSPVAFAIQGVVGAPLTLCAQAVLAAATLAVQGFADIELPNGQRRPVSMFYLSLADSGERKTSCDTEALRPVRERERELESKRQTDLPLYHNQRDSYEQARKRAMGEANKTKMETELYNLGPPPEPPLETVLTCPEPTFEGLTHLLDMGQPSIGIFSSEGGQFFGGYGMSEDNRLRTIAGYSNLWDGESIRRVRRGDGSKVLHGRRLSIHLMIQPDVAKPYLADGLLQQQGFFSRFLICAPASTMGTRFHKEPSDDCRKTLGLYTQRLLEALRLPMPLADGQRNELCPRVLPLSPEAKPLWIAFHDECEGKLAKHGDYADIRGFANKLPEQSLRLAGVLTLVESPTASVVNAENMRRGIILARYYAGEAIRIAEAGLIDTHTNNAERVRQWLLERWGHDAISIPDLQHSVPISYVRTSAERCKKVVALLAQHGWLVPVAGGAVIDGKKRREVWRIIRP